MKTGSRLSALAFSHKVLAGNSVFNYPYIFRKRPTGYVRELMTFPNGKHHHADSTPGPWTGPRSGYGNIPCKPEPPAVAGGAVLPPPAVAGGAVLPPPAVAGRVSAATRAVVSTPGHSGQVSQMERDQIHYRNGTDAYFRCYTTLTPSNYGLA